MQLENFSHFCQHASNSGVLFYYTGEFSQNVIGAMSDSLKEQLDAASVTGPSRRKVFSAFVEMAQNVVHYADAGAAGGLRLGTLAVSRCDGKFYVMCGNPVRREHVERLRAKLEPLRSMSLDEIKAAYREQLRNEGHAGDPISRGAGLGFLTVARESSEPIEYQIVFSSQANDHASSASPGIHAGVSETEPEPGAARLRSDSWRGSPGLQAGATHGHAEFYLRAAI